jgi:hypothetical protein
MAELLRHYLYYFFHSMEKLDYAAIGWSIFLSFLIMILGATLKKRGLSYFFLFLGMLTLFFAPPALKILLDDYLRKSVVTIDRVKRLVYSHALLVEGTIRNAGKVDFSRCDLVLSVYRPNKTLGAWTPWIKPLRVAIRPFDKPLTKGEDQPFKIIVDDFPALQDFNVSLIGRCYP